MSDLTKRLCRPGYDLQKEQAIQEAIIEIRELRAKIEAMEKQEPFDADSDAFRSAFEAALKAGNWPATRQGDGYRSPSTQIAWRIAFSTVNRLTLYALPGAQELNLTAPAVQNARPQNMTRNEVINLAVSAGFHFYDAGHAPTLHTTKANYPEEYFIHFASLVAQPAPSIPEGWKLVPIAPEGWKPAPSVPVDLITDYLVSISAHVAHQDDLKAQAEIGELLRMLAAAPEAKP